MKKISVIVAAMVAMSLCCVSLMAQENPGNDGEKKMSREQMAQAQARRIASDLALDDKTSDKFVKAYCSYQQEIWAVGPETPMPRSNADSLVTDEQVAKAIEARFDHARKIIDLREKYYKEYSKFLSPKQIQKVYESERKMMDRFSQGRHNRPGQPGQGPRDGKGPQPRPERQNRPQADK